MQSEPMPRPSTQAGTNQNYTNTKKEEHTVSRMGSYFPKQWSLSYLNLTVLSNIYLRVKFDLVSCSFNLTDRRHVNIVNLSPGGGGGGYSEIFLIHKLGVFFGQSFESRYFWGVYRKKKYFLGRQFLWIFLGGPIKIEYFLVFNAGKRVILSVFQQLQIFLGVC